MVHSGKREVREENKFFRHYLFFLKNIFWFNIYFLQFQSSTDNLWKKLFMTHVLYYSVNFEVLRNEYTVENDKLEKK